MKEALDQVVGAFDQADSTARPSGKGNDVAPQMVAGAREMIEDEIDGCARVLRWGARGALCGARRREAIEGGADVVELGHLRAGRIGGRTGRPASGVA